MSKYISVKFNDKARKETKISFSTSRVGGYIKAVDISFKDSFEIPEELAKRYHDYLIYIDKDIETVNIVTNEATRYKVRVAELENKIHNLEISLYNERERALKLQNPSTIFSKDQDVEYNGEVYKIAGLELICLIPYEKDSNGEYILDENGLKKLRTQGNIKKYVSSSEIKPIVIK